jgi:hypothetical protein
MNMARKRIGNDDLVVSIKVYERKQSGQSDSIEFIENLKNKLEREVLSKQGEIKILSEKCESVRSDFKKAEKEVLDEIRLKIENGVKLTGYYNHSLTLPKAIKSKCVRIRQLDELSFAVEQKDVHFDGRLIDGWAALRHALTLLDLSELDDKTWFHRFDESMRGSMSVCYHRFIAGHLKLKTDLR